MKKIKFLCVIIFFVMFTLVSCKDNLLYLDSENSNTEKSNDGNFEYTDSDDNLVGYNVMDGADYLQFSDGYLYFAGEISIPNPVNNNKYVKTLMRYNVKTGAVSSVCADPLCGHNTSDCPFYDMNYAPCYYLKNDKISFTRTYAIPKYSPDGSYNGLETWGGFVSYDLKNAKFTVHNKFDVLSGVGEVLLQLYVENYRYFYDKVYDEKTDKWETLLTRMDLNTSKIFRLSEDNVVDEELARDSAGFTTKFLFAFDGRIYMTDMVTIYSTDYDMKNKKIHATGNFALDVKTDGKYIYYGVKPETESKYMLQNVRRMNFDGSGDIDLGIVAEKFNLTENYIYYITPDEISIGKSKISNYGGSEIVLFGSEIRRCAHDGTNNELVYKFEGDMEYYRFIGAPLVVGNYIYGVYSYWIDSDSDGMFQEGDNYSSNNSGDFNIMRINITTGEIYYIRVDK